MATRIGINGFGRIGRQTLRAALERHPNDLEIVAVNDLTDTKTNAHLFKYDTTYGTFPGEVSAQESSISVNGKSIEVLAYRDPAEIPWGKYGVQIVVESTGLFTTADKAKAHLHDGVKKVIISRRPRARTSPWCMGVNEERLRSGQAPHHLQRLCTTNCLAPAAKVVNDNFGIVRGLMNTIHSYTNDQNILDQAHKDLRRARAAARTSSPLPPARPRPSPWSFPELKGKFDGFSLRVPTSPSRSSTSPPSSRRTPPWPTSTPPSRAAAEGPLKGILGYTEEPLVS